MNFQKITSDNFENQIHAMMQSFLTLRLLNIVAQLGIAELLNDDSKSVDYLAQKTNSNKQALYRSLRMLASHGIFQETKKNYFAHTDASRLLEIDHKKTVKSLLLHEDEPRFRAYAQLDHTIKTGKPAFNKIYDMNYFTYLSQDPEAADRFDDGMKRVSAQEEHAIAHSFDFNRFKEITDIGGGRGGLLSNILQKFLAVKGTLYELPYVIDDLDQSTKEQFGDRLTFKKGSFFDAIPEGSDCYILKRVLHDWSDEECVKILQHCAQALDSGTLLIMEGIIPSDNEPNMLKGIDVLLMALFSGRERTLDEFKELLQQAGLEIIKIHKTPSMLSIIEVQRINLM